MKRTAGQAGQASSGTLISSRHHALGRNLMGDRAKMAKDQTVARSVKFHFQLYELVLVVTVLAVLLAAANPLLKQFSLEERTRIAAVWWRGLIGCALTVLFYGYMEYRLQRQGGPPLFVLNRCGVSRRFDTVANVMLCLGYFCGLVLLSLAAAKAEFFEGLTRNIGLVLGIPIGMCLAAIRWPAHTAALCEYGVVNGWSFYPWRSLRYHWPQPSRLTIVLPNNTSIRLKVPDAERPAVATCLERECSSA